MILLLFFSVVKIVLNSVKVYDRYIEIIIFMMVQCVVGIHRSLHGTTALTIYQSLTTHYLSLSIAQVHTVQNEVYSTVCILRELSAWYLVESVKNSDLLYSSLVMDLLGLTAGSLTK